MLNLVREGEEDYIEAIRYRRRLKIFENFLFSISYTLCPVRRSLVATDIASVFSSRIISSRSPSQISLIRLASLSRKTWTV